MANFSENRHISDVELNQGVCSFFHRSLFLTKRNSIFEKIDKIIFEVKSFQWDDYYFVLINVLLEVACRFCRMSRLCSTLLLNTVNSLLYFDKQFMIEYLCSFVL